MDGFNSIQFNSKRPERHRTHSDRGIGREGRTCHEATSPEGMQRDGTDRRASSRGRWTPLEDRHVAMLPFPVSPSPPRAIVRNPLSFRFDPAHAADVVVARRAGEAGVARRDHASTPGGIAPEVALCCRPPPSVVCEGLSASVALLPRARGFCASLIFMFVVPLARSFSFVGLRLLLVCPWLRLGVLLEPLASPTCA